MAKWIADEQVVGWFQGRAEFGPRALGNRSILGDPRNPKMQQTMNLKIKQRESFRPFAPAILLERASEYFAHVLDSPYMLLVDELKQQHRLNEEDFDKTVEVQGFDKLNQVRSTVPAITHVDYSARVQTVNASDNPRFHQLISAFADLTGVPIVINTSFNVRGEPPVCRPQEAIRCFLATDMDYLVLGNIVLDKQKMSAADIAQAKATTFEAD